MNQKTYDKIKEVLMLPANTPFEGKSGEAKHFLSEVLYTQAKTPFEAEESYTNLRVAAFILVRSGLTYQELGAPIPLNHITVLEHIKLETWTTELVEMASKRKRFRDG